MNESYPTHSFRVAESESGFCPKNRKIVMRPVHIVKECCTELYTTFIYCFTFGKSSAAAVNKSVPDSTTGAFPLDKFTISFNAFW